jgi:hypothetical protein
MNGILTEDIGPNPKIKSMNRLAPTFPEQAKKSRQGHIVRNLLLGSTLLFLIGLGSLCTWQFYPFETPARLPEEFLLTANDFPENWVAGYLAYGRL